MQSYFDNNFLFKEEAFSAKRELETKLLRTDPIPHKVVLGTDGWYFLGDGYSSVISESKGISLDDSCTIAKTIRTMLDEQHWLEEQGIAYLIAIPRNKHSIYGHWLPITQSAGPTKHDQLKYAMDTAGIRYVDLSSEFGLYPDSTLYQKTDTHWNDFGAYLGSKSLIEEISKTFPAIKMLPTNMFHFTRDTIDNNDLVEMLNIKEQEIVPILRANYHSSVENYATKPDEQEEHLKRYCSNVNEVKVLMYRDSYCKKMIQFLKECFGESVFVWQPNMQKEQVTAEQPNIVVREIIERNSEWFYAKGD